MTGIWRRGVDAEIVVVLFSTHNRDSYDELESTHGAIAETMLDHREHA